MRKINFKDDYTCTVIGLVVNGVLTLFKLLAGIVGRSQAMVADAIHSLSDSFATVIAFISLKLAKKPPDDNHPYGHENIEVIASWLVAIILVLVGAYIGYSAVYSVYCGHLVKPGKLALIAALVSIATKEILYRYTIYVGELLNSPVIKANALEHRSDAFSSIGSLLGIAGAMWGWRLLDPLAGIVISFFIIKMGLDILRDTSRIIMDTKPSEEFLTGIKDTINNFDGVKGYSDLRVHSIGRNFIIDVSICVDRNITVEQGHKIASVLKEKLLKNNQKLNDIIIHVEPKIE